MKNTHIGDIINETIEEFISVFREVMEREEERRRRNWESLTEDTFRKFESPVIEWQIPEERKISEE